MNVLLWQRGIRRGLLTVIREREWATTFGAILGVLFLVQMLLAVGLGVQGVKRLLQAQTDLRLEIRDGAPDAAVQEFYASVRAFPATERAFYITKEKAYEEEKRRDPELVSFLEEYKLGNPFSDSVAVTLRRLSDYDAFAAFVKDPRWSVVVDPTFLSKATDQEAQIHELLRVTRAGGSLVVLFLLLTAAVTLFVLVELVRRRALARSEEILVERLVGADHFFVLLPFVTEAFLLLTVSVLASFLLLLLLLQILPLVLPGAVGVFAGLRKETLPLFRLWLPVSFMLELFLIPAFSFLGAFLGMWPLLRSSRLGLVAH